MLSEVANFTPFSDFNQSPRNMYQCQMGKQTMGTPATAYAHRTDGKLYRIQTPQKPIARTKQYDELTMDEYPQGTNMVVCVIAYTGYDMEDAMILNKSAVDRGLAHGSIYKTETIDLKGAKCVPAVVCSMLLTSSLLCGLLAGNGDRRSRPVVGRRVRVAANRPILVPFTAGSQLFAAGAPQQPLPMCLRAQSQQPLYRSESTR